MAKGASRDAKQETQKVTLEIPTKAFIALGKILDPDFRLIEEDTDVKRAKGSAVIWPLECDSSLIEKWIVDTVVSEAYKAEKAHKAKREALMESLKEDLIASGWTPPKKKK